VNQALLWVKRVAVLGWLAFAAAAAQTPEPPPRTAVLWISVDGLRGDYIGRAPLPFFDRLVAEGLWTKKMAPPFPSITFPSHVTEATGVGADRHGVPGNSFLVDGKLLKFPSDSSLLEAEPIWITAQRQGVRAGVFDWPLSQAQRGPVRSAYFHDLFVGALRDEERLQQLIGVWQADQNPEPLRLLMGYAGGIDKAGHRFGPESPEVNAALIALDTHLARFLEQALAIWNRRMRKQDDLYLVITTDHGMSAVEQLVNIEAMLGEELRAGIDIVTNGNVGNLHLSRVPEAERAARITAIVERLRREKVLRVFRKEELPPEWHYAHPKRVGDIIVVAAKGNTLDNRLPQPFYTTAEADGPRGMHGYPVEENPEMYGFSAIWRYPRPLVPRDLGEVAADQWHATIAAILGIQPAPGAAAKPIPIEEK
jgi:ectonucleotide pyrophosphatase/phosphodiesterase family protein 5